MAKLYYCMECRRVIESETDCTYCEGKDIRTLDAGAPVNVIGTKLKGKVYKIRGNKVKLLLIDEANLKVIKEYKAERLKKIL